MNEYVKISKSEITVDEKGSVTIPVEINIRIVQKRNLQAVAKLTYAGLVINDIKIVSSRGRVDIYFPYKTWQSHGVDKTAYVAFPCVPELSTQLNTIILRAYTEAMLEHQDNIIEKNYNE